MKNFNLVNIFKARFWTVGKVLGLILWLFLIIVANFLVIFILNVIFTFVQSQEIALNPQFLLIQNYAWEYAPVVFGGLLGVVWLGGLGLWYYMVTKNFSDQERLEFEKEEFGKWTLNEHKNLGTIKEFAQEFHTDLSQPGWVVKTDYVKQRSQNQGWWKMRTWQPKYYILPQKSGIVLGTIGSGKSQKINIPTLMANALIPNAKKASWLITDPKGELFNATASYLQAHGYEIFCLNFRNVNESHFWNPLTFCWDYYQEHQKNKEARLKIEAEEKKLTLALKKRFMDPDWVVQQGLKWGTLLADLLKATTFSAQMPVKLVQEIQKIQKLITEKQQYFQAEIQYQDLYKKEINLIAEKVINSNNSKDQFWDLMAAKIFVATLNFYLKNPRIKKADFTLYNICMALCNENEIAKYINQLDPTDVDKIFSNPVINSPEKTRSSIFASVSSYLTPFLSETLKYMLSESSFDLRTIWAKPTAIFLITPDDNSLYNKLIEIYIQQQYQSLVQIADNELVGKKAFPNPIYFLLEEFGNIAQIPDFDKMIGVSRSRNIHYLLTLQDLGQLENVYGRNKAQIIRTQCSLLVFLNSQNDETKNTILKILGERQTIKKASRSDKKGKFSEAVSEKPLMDFTELSNIDGKSALVLLTKTKPSYIKTKMAYELYPEKMVGYEVPWKIDASAAISKMGPLEPLLLWNSFYGEPIRMKFANWSEANENGSFFGDVIGFYQALQNLKVIWTQRYGENDPNLKQFLIKEMPEMEKVIIHHINGAWNELLDDSYPDHGCEYETEEDYQVYWDFEKKFNWLCKNNYLKQLLEILDWNNLNTDFNQQIQAAHLYGKKEDGKNPLILFSEAFVTAFPPKEGLGDFIKILEKYYQGTLNKKWLITGNCGESLKEDYKNDLSLVAARWKQQWKILSTTNEFLNL